MVAEKGHPQPHWKTRSSNEKLAAVTQKPPAIMQNPLQECKIRSGNAKPAAVMQDPQQ